MSNLAAREYARNRAAAIREGTWRPLVDAEPVREHLRMLMAARVTLKTVTEASGLDPSTVEALLYGRPASSTRRKERPGRFLTKRVRPETAEKIMAIGREELMGTITATEAAHVLHYFASGGMAPGSFTARLIDAIAHADPGNQRKLGIAFPGYVHAVYIAQNREGGIADLRAIAAQERVGEALP